MSTPPIRLLFVCSGNICRSPAAEALARALAPEFGLAVEVGSAGTLRIEGQPANPYMTKVGLREYGIDLRAHRSRGLTRELIDRADLVLTMETHHAVSARELAPDAPLDRIRPLGPWAGVAEIDDPNDVRWSMVPYRRTLDLLKTGIAGMFSELRSRR